MKKFPLVTLWRLQEGSIKVCEVFQSLPFLTSPVCFFFFCTIMADIYRKGLLG